MPQGAAPRKGSTKPPLSLTPSRHPPQSVTLQACGHFELRGQGQERLHHPRLSLRSADVF